jgi:hypothetical protein
VKFPLIVATILLITFTGCRTGSHLRFTHDDGKIVFKHGERLHEVSADEFALVLDWSRDYSRQSKGVGAVFGNKFLFSGALNHSRDIYFIYDLRSEELQIVPNALTVRMARTGRWAAVIETPLYADDNGRLDVIIDDPTNKVATIRKEHFEQMRWTGEELTLKVH